MSGKDKNSGSAPFNREADDITPEEVEPGPSSGDLVAKQGALTGEVLSKELASIRESIDIPLIPINAWIARLKGHHFTKVQESIKKTLEAIKAADQAEAEATLARASLEKVLAETAEWTPEKLRAKAEREFELEEAEDKERLYKAQAKQAKAELAALEALEALKDAEADSQLAEKRREARLEAATNPPQKTRKPRRESAADRREQQFEDILHYGTAGEAAVQAEAKIKKFLDELGREPTEEELENIRALKVEAKRQDLSRGE